MLGLRSFSVSLGDLFCAIGSVVAVESVGVRDFGGTGEKPDDPEPIWSFEHRDPPANQQNHT